MIDLLLPLAKEIHEWRFAAPSWSAGAAFLVAIGIIAFVAVLGASLLPARRAANLPPVATLRGSGQ